MKERVLLDANIIIELLNGSKITGLNEAIMNTTPCISAVTYAISWYFIEKGRADSRMINVFKNLEILPVTKKTCFTGLEISKGEDVEDGIQVACCLENKIKKIITIEGDLFKYQKQIQIIKLEQ